MSRIVLRAVGSPAAGLYPATAPWLYLVSWNVDAHDGRGEAEWGPAEKAHVFVDARQAWETWREQSTVRPVRDDGLPNRPLTAFHVVIIDLERM